jgi:hypothetical protein
MDEEELVMQFTEERNLITLGWVSQNVFHRNWMVFWHVVIRYIRIRRSRVSPSQTFEPILSNMPNQ